MVRLGAEDTADALQGNAFQKQVAYQLLVLIRQLEIFALANELPMAGTAFVALHEVVRFAVFYYFWTAAYKVGSFTTRTTVAFDAENWTKNLRDLGWAMLLGSILISSLVSAIAFFATKYGLKFYRKTIEGHGKPAGFRPPQ